MKVLFFCTDDYPRNGACTSLLRNLFYEGGLVETLEQLDVMTVKYHYEQRDSETADGINVFRTMAWQFIYANEIRRSIRLHPLAMLRGIVSKVVSAMIKNLFPWHFLDCITIQAFLRGLKRIHAERYDVIVAMAGNFHTVEAVRRFTNQPCAPRFIIYQVDPCSTKVTDSPSTLEARKRFEQKAYGQADAVLTTPIICNELVGTACEKFTCKFVPMEFPNVTAFVERRSKTVKDGILCVFAGSIYSGIRDPRYTLKLFRKLVDKNVQLQFVGVNENQIPYDLRGERFHILGVKSLDETRAIIENADFLVNIGNAMLNQVPSKLFDYISTGKPIVNICKHRDCPTLQYMEKYPYALNLFEEDKILEEQVEKLQTYLMKYQGVQASYHEILNKYASCTPKYCAKQMIEAICNSLAE